MPETISTSTSLRLPCGHTHWLAITSLEEEGALPEPVVELQADGCEQAGAWEACLMGLFRDHVKKLLDELARSEARQAHLLGELARAEARQARLLEDRDRAFNLMHEFSGLWHDSETRRVAVERELERFRQACECWRRPQQVHRRGAASTHTNYF
ncbi:hypothetical protein OH77DRAFT_1416530 [Trametes cingulata]|nr:hypothetical protein OH77DRAFT_1416530 [Trametes cingulata]